MTALYQLFLILKSVVLLLIAICSIFLLCKSYLNSNWESYRSVGFSQKMRCSALDGRYSVSDTKAYYTPSQYVNLSLVYSLSSKMRDVCFDEQDLSNCALILNIFTANELTSSKMDDYFGDDRNYFDYSYWIIVLSALAFIFAIVFEREYLQRNTDPSNVIFMTKLNLAICLVTAALSFASASKFATITAIECPILQNPSSIVPFDKVDFCIRLSGCNGVLKAVVNPDDALFRNYQEVFLFLATSLIAFTVLQIIMLSRSLETVNETVFPEVEIRITGSSVTDRRVTLLEELRAAARLAIEYRPIRINQEILSRNWREIPHHKLYNSIKYSGECSICLIPLCLGKGITNGGCWKSTSQDNLDAPDIFPEFALPICSLESQTQDDAQTDALTPLLSDSPLATARKQPRVKVRSRRESTAMPRWEASSNLITVRSFNQIDNALMGPCQSILVNDEEGRRAHPDAGENSNTATETDSDTSALQGPLAQPLTTPHFHFMSRQPSAAVSFPTSQFATPRATPSEAAVVEAPCGHAFHKSCLLEWATLRTSCPICRLELIGVSEDYLV